MAKLGCPCGNQLWNGCDGDETEYDFVPFGVFEANYDSCSFFDLRNEDEGCINIWKCDMCDRFMVFDTEPKVTRYMKCICVDDLPANLAMCIQNDGSADLLGEFSISETGGIDGAPGDQTGRESWIHDYYSGRWDGILHYNGKADTGGAPGGSGSGAPSGDVSELAERVIAGEFGNGDARRASLGSRYDEVQAEVNRILSGGSSSGSYDVDALARRVIAGEFGNGDERKRRLGDKYATVQKRVNEILGAAGTTKTSIDVDAMARAVIRGDYGNGEERKHRLGSYYSIVQARVNEMLT